MAKSPLLSYLRVQKATDQMVLQALRSSAAVLDGELRRLAGRTGIGAALRAEQLRMTQVAMHKEMARLWTSVGNITQAQSAVAAAAGAESILEGSESVLSKVFSQADIDYMTRSARASAARSLDVLQERVSGSSKISLAESVYDNTALANGKIDEIVDAALARGASASDLAKDVRSYINPNTPGGARYASMRLGRTEINNAFHASQVREGQNSPWVTGLKWNLSGSHPRPDECNQYAESSHYDGGDAGVWQPQDVPGKPHPQCLCYTTPVTPDRDEFVRRFEAEEYDEYLDDLGLVTPKTQRVADEAVRKATIAEQDLTKLMNEIVEPLGGEMAGLEFAVKGPDSLARKIAGDLADSGMSAQDVVDELYDINRYTAVFSETQYSVRVEQALEELRSRGHTLNVKNYWEVSDNPYQGINVQVLSSTGQRFELQFHTTKSLDVKEGQLHHLYELFRVESDEKKIERLLKQMFEVSSKIPVPKSVSRIRSGR